MPDRLGHRGNRIRLEIPRRAISTVERAVSFLSRATENAEDLNRIGVDKSSSHQLSQNEIGGDNPCSRHLSGNSLLSDYRINQDLRAIAETPEGDR